MAISPPSDIVMDVMRAADPARVRQATKALTDGRAMAGIAVTNVNSPARTADAGSFAARLALAEKAPARAAAGRTVAGVRFHNAPAGADRGPVNLLAGLDVPPRTEMSAGVVDSGRPSTFAVAAYQTHGAAPKAEDSGRKGALHKAFAGLEGLLLRQMLEGAFAAGGAGRESIFGTGLAGSTWRSMMAAIIADQVAAAGGLGLTSQLLADPIRLEMLTGSMRS